MQHLKKEVNYELYFWPPDKHQSLLQIDTIILGVCNQHAQKYPKQQVCKIFATSQGKHEGCS